MTDDPKPSATTPEEVAREMVRVLDHECGIIGPDPHGSVIAGALRPILSRLVRAAKIEALDAAIAAVQDLKTGWEHSAEDGQPDSAACAEDAITAGCCIDAIAKLREEATRG